MKLITTLAHIKSDNMCNDFWEKLLEGLGEDLKKPDLDREVSLRFILENNGLPDALWSTSCFPELATLIALYALWCAERVRHLMTDQRSTNALDVTRRYLNGEATREELENARIAVFEVTSSWFASDKISSVGSIANNSGLAAISAACAEHGAINVVCAAGMSVLDEKREDQTQEFLRLIDCYENGIEYTI